MRRERKKTARDFLRDKVEANVQRIWDVYDQGLDAYSDGEPDVKVRTNTAKELLAEAYGKPTQRVETLKAVMLLHPLQTVVQEYDLELDTIELPAILPPS